MQRAVGSDDSSILGKNPPRAEIERLPERIGDAPARLLDDEGACGLIPDFFAVVRLFRGKKSQQNFSSAAGEDGVFRLTVHAYRLRGDAKFFRDRLDFPRVGMPGFKRTQQPRVRGRVLCGNADAFPRVGGERFEGVSPRPFAARREEQRPRAAALGTNPLA